MQRYRKNVISSIFVIVFLSFTSFFVKAESDTAWRVAISGKVANMTDSSARVITAINCNIWKDKISRHAVEIDSAGEFNTYVEIPYGHNFTIYYDRNFFCQYAEPGDSLFLTIDAANMKSGAHYSGSHERLNNEYGRVYADIFSKSEVELPTEEMPKEQYLDNFKKICSGLENILNNYADSVGLGEESKDLMRRSLLFGAANYALDHKDKTPERELEFFADSIFGLDDEDNLREMMFPFHISAYLNKLTEVVKPDSILQMINAVTELHPKSLNRDVMMAILLKKSDEEVGCPKISRELFSSPRIYKMLYEHATNIELLPDEKLVDGTILEYRNGEATNSDYSSLTELLRKEFNGKIVYLDLWATWCGPCIESNKSLPEVADFFTDKDIVFISVALRSDIDKWKKLVSGHPENCRSFFINSGADAEIIMSAFGMKGFPTYRIVGKDSKIINQDPPRPNNPAIYESLLKLLQTSEIQIERNAFAIDYVVQGQIEEMDGKLLYLYDYDKEITFDSTLVSKGQFKFQGSYERPAYVRVENGRFFSNCVLDTLAVVDFDTHYPSSGSLLNQKLINFMSENQKIEDELDKFGDELRKHGFEQPEFGEIYKHLYDKLFPHRLQLLYKTIEDNPNGVGECAIMSFGDLWGVTPEQWGEAYYKMSPYLKERRLADYFNNMHNSLRNSQPGKPFIDISAKTVDGKDAKLSDYVGKGKYVLIDFWASWCGPCREEAENTLRPLYEKYKDDDRFMILGVATWDQHDKTIAALEKFNYPWPQIIDAGETPMKLYGFNGIPMIFLISPDGTILKRNLRGESIIEAVDSELKQNL